MKPEEITALAREYAEETGETSPTTLDIKQRNMERHLEWLSQCYCLVEKAKVIETYNRTWNEWNFTLDAENKANSKFLLSALESLFPEIAKEVQS